jgi:hypothetical protein
MNLQPASATRLVTEALIVSAPKRSPNEHGPPRPFEPVGRRALRRRGARPLAALLRLIATEVATQLRERADSAIRRRVVWDKQGSPESNRGPVDPDRGNFQGPKSPRRAEATVYCSTIIWKRPRRSWEERPGRVPTVCTVALAQKVSFLPPVEPLRKTGGPGQAAVKAQAGEWIGRGTRPGQSQDQSRFSGSAYR